MAACIRGHYIKHPSQTGSVSSPCQITGDLFRDQYAEKPGRQRYIRTLRREEDGLRPAIRMLPSSMLRMMAKGRFHGGIQFVKEGKAAQLLPPSLYKHATSKRVLNDYWVKRMSSSLKGEGPDSKVNKKGQTLLERHAANEIQRPCVPIAIPMRPRASISTTRCCVLIATPMRPSASISSGRHLPL